MVSQPDENHHLAARSLDALTAHIAVIETDGTILTVNRSWRDFGLANGAPPGIAGEGANYLDACATAGPDGEAVAGLIREVIAGDRIEAAHEYPCHSPDELRWFECKITRFSGGGRIRAVIAHENITKRKLAEDALRVREEQLLRQRNALVSLTGAAVLSWGDISVAFRRFTETAAETLEVGRASIWFFDRNRTSIACLDLFDAARHRHEHGVELFSSDYPVYFEALDGFELIDADDAGTDPRTCEFARDYFPANGITSMLDAPIHFGGALHGVLCHEHTGPPRRWTSNEKTFAIALANLVSLALEEWERLRVEERLRLHSAALDAASNGIVITDLNGSITWANSAFSRITGYSLEEAAGRNPRDLLRSGQHDAGFFENLWQTILAGQVWKGIIVNRRKDGSLYSEYQSISPIRDSAGAITHFVAVKENVTEKLAAERKLDEARERLQRAVRAGNIALWEWDLPTGSVVYSPEWLAQTGLAAEALSGTTRDWFDRVLADDLGPLRQVLRDCMDAPGTWMQKEFRLRCAGGEQRWILMGASAEAGESGTAVRIIGTNIDITDRKRLEMEFLQSQKMEGIGQLAGGVAHDFNNLLGVIGGYSEYALDSLSEADPVRENIMEIKRAADRAAALTRQLLAFSRRQVLQPEVLNINYIVESLQKMIGRLIGENIETVLELAPDLGRVMADPGQIEQILLNLTVNARDAMPQGGRLILSTCNQSVDEAAARKRPGGHPGEYISLSVRDTGIGMDRRTQDRIFDPFFTTKEKGKGTGLGLATVYGIVKQSGGNIWVDSEPGAGAAFEVYLPRIDAPAAGAQASALAAGIAPGSETILLVEDEESFRAVTSMMLTRSGYAVHAAEDGEHAIALMARHAGDIDLLLTDVVMPGLSGPDMVKRLRGDYPALKVLFMSGYTDDAIVHHGVLDADIAFVNKPFTFAQLTRKIREVIDRA